MSDMLAKAAGQFQTTLANEKLCLFCPSCVKQGDRKPASALNISPFHQSSVEYRGNLVLFVLKKGFQRGIGNVPALRTVIADTRRMTTLPSCFQRDFVDASKLPEPLPASPTPVTKTHADVVQFVIEKKIKEAKNLVRTQHWPIDDPNRGELWLKLCQGHTKETAPCDFYHSTVRESLGGQWPVNMPAFVDPIFDEEYLLSAEGQRRAERVLFVMSVSHPFVTYCPILHPVASLLLHYLPEEQTYECVCALVDSTAVRHLSQTRLTHDISSHTLMRLTKHLEKKTYSRLFRKFRREDEVEKVFSAWQLWIFRGLPFYHLVRVMDCFLLEGVRALYRIAMAILILYVKEHSKDYPSKSFISRVFKSKKTKNGGTCSRDGAQDAESFLDGVIAFCKDMPYNVDKFLKTAYNIQVGDLIAGTTSVWTRNGTESHAQGISAKLLSQQLLKSEMHVRSRSSGRTRPASESAGGGGRHLQVASSCLSVKNDKYCATRAVSVGVIGLANFRSEVLTGEQMAIVWNWLPARITMLQPEVVYSTNTHGSSLTSLFAHADTREPTVLAVLTTRGDRFGAYCSARWSERKQRTYFGTGETFLFTFVPEPRCFAWVGADSSQDVPHSSKLFLSANQHSIQIGGGNGVGLYIDGSLENGRTEHCDTFDNSPLASCQDFVVQIAEVVAFV